MKIKKESYMLGLVLKKIAPRIKARVLLEPTWQIAGQITFKSGRISYFKFNTIDLNPLGAAEISSDKDFANFFMSHMGYATIPNSKTFFSDEWAKAIREPNRTIDDAYHYAKEIGFPVVVKPNNGSRGANVAKAHSKKELYRALRAIFRKNRVALMQPYMPGRDYRLVVLDEELISAYERIPLSIEGNGRASIRTLLLAKQHDFEIRGRDSCIDFEDPRMIEKLKRQKLTLESVAQNGERVFLLDNANLSNGGESIDVTGNVHPDFKKLAVDLTRDMGLRLCGVDLIVDGDFSKASDKYWILEINASPGLDHYSRSGAAQQKIVEDMYLEVLKHLDRPSVSENKQCRN